MFLEGQSKAYFTEKVVEGEPLLYFSVMGLGQSQIVSVKAISDEPKYGYRDCLTLELKVKNAGAHLAEFIREHWDHFYTLQHGGAVAVPGGGEFNEFVFASCECGAELRIPREAFDE